MYKRQGLAAALDQETFARVVRETIAELAPGAVGDILTEALQQGTRSARQETGETALAAGFFAALIAGTTALAQVERGANRIYGVERDRPFLRKYLLAMVLAVTAGTLALLSLVVLVAGSAVKDAAGWSEGFDTAWAVIRWPLGLACVVGAVSLLFEVSPYRRQPEATWLAFGGGVAAGLWLVFMGGLKVYIDATESFGSTYGPVAGTIGLLLWAFLTSLALFGGLAFAAQLEAVRAGAPDPRREMPEPARIQP